MTTIAVRRALISVYDKAGLEELARGLHQAGVETDDIDADRALRLGVVHEGPRSEAQRH